MTKSSLIRRAYRFGRKLMQAAIYYAPTQICGAVTHVRTAEPMVALTFDDGPHPKFTPQLLDLLERHNARATFFVVGLSAQRYPDLIRRIRESGHVLGNHSWDHPSFPALSRVERERQLAACEALIGPDSHRLFRPPYANQTAITALDAWRLGYRVVMYSVSASDWRDDPADVIFKRLAESLKPGSIVLLHDALFTCEQERFTDRRPTLEAIHELLTRYGEKYRFVTVPELLRSGRPYRTWWHQPGDVQYMSSLRRTHG